MSRPIVAHTTDGMCSWRCGRCGIHFNDFDKVPCPVTFEDLLEFVKKAASKGLLTWPLKEEAANLIIHHYQTKKVMTIRYHQGWRRR